jgi:succinyl-CoA synthetase alpha subunit
MVDSDTGILVQGITGRQGAFHTGLMLEYGARVVAGVVPGRGGQSVHGVPVYNTVEDANAAHSINAGVVFVPPFAAADAVCEQVDSGIGLVVVITEGIPVLDSARMLAHARAHGARVLGPNCPGLILPGQTKLGIIPGDIALPGRVGVVSRSGTLTYEVIQALTDRRIGQGLCLGIGGDPIKGLSFVDALTIYEADPDIDAMVLIGEIGGRDEEQAAEFITQACRKPVIGFVAGRAAPPERRMGHAGAIVSGGTGAAEGKIAALAAAGVAIARHPDHVGDLVAARL